MVNQSHISGNPDYLAKDYSSFRKLMLDHLALQSPEWQERHAADIGVTLIEALAYVGDYLSYYQDAVATESYLTMARRRVSVRRHARLMDYYLNEGCSARVWAHIKIHANELTLPGKTRLMTQVPDMAVVIHPDKVPEIGGVIFETVAPFHLYERQNEMRLIENHDLETGSFKAKLSSIGLGLVEGQILILSQAETAFNQAVKLTHIQEDIAKSQTHITWDMDDRLSSAFKPDAETLVLGNIVLADEGRTVETQLPAIKDAKTYAPSILCANLAYVDSMRDYHLVPSASALSRPDANKASPAISLYEARPFLPAPVLQRPVWQGARDLINAGPNDYCFVAEPIEKDTLSIRFGDGVNGRRPNPDWEFTAKFRIGLGINGNISAGSLGHVITDTNGIISITNPLPAMGGAERETIEHAKSATPMARETKTRCVNAPDYEHIGSGFPGVRTLSARRIWEDKRPIVKIRVDRDDNLPVGDTFIHRLRAYFRSYKKIGDDLDIQGVTYIYAEVGLNIVLEHDAAKTPLRLKQDISYQLFFDIGAPAQKRDIEGLVLALQDIASVRVAHLNKKGGGEADLDRITVGKDDRIRILPQNITLHIRDYDAPDI